MEVKLICFTILSLILGLTIFGYFCYTVGREVGNTNKEVMPIVKKPKPRLPDLDPIVPTSKE